MKPGDLIEWYFKHNNESVSVTDELWSSTMKRWAFIGEVSLLLCKNTTTYSWLNSKGYFRARVDDACWRICAHGPQNVFPRVYG